MACLFFWFVQRPHLQNRLITQILAHSHKEGCPLNLFNVSDTPRVIVVLLMGREGADNFERGIADVDMTGGSAKKYAIRARRYSSYICTLRNVKMLSRGIRVWRLRPQRVAVEVRCPLRQVL